MADWLRLAMTAWLLGAAIMLAAWLGYRRRRNAAVVDVAWSLSLPATVLLYAALAPGDRVRRGAMAVMFCVWGGRLSTYLWRTRIRGRAEDERYSALRAAGSPVAVADFFFFFQAQAVLAVVFSIPALIAALDPAEAWSRTTQAAVVLWAAALTGEAAADRQLERFKADPSSRGRTCRDGLWRYSRHPNYFFEWLTWVAFALFALTSPSGVLALIAPALMLYLLLRVTGIPATEAQALRSRGAEYRRYQESTSVFLPWPPRQGRPMIDAVIDSGLLPDIVLRAGIRRVVAMRLREQEAGGVEQQSKRFSALLDALHTGPVAVATADANGQHYEVPGIFFQRVLGPQLKYSASWWPPGVRTLAEAESHMLALTTERAGCADGQQILELGCGWGSLTLHLAQAFPASRITAVSNSSSQRRFVMARARERGLGNVEVMTADVNDFHTRARFDRVVSVEMLEHVRNHRLLFSRIARWLEIDGRFFAHVFAHRRCAYALETAGASDWIARHFFTGGMMPSDDWFLHVQEDLAVERHWRLDGTHYQRTAEAWLANLDRHHDEVQAILAGAYGPEEARRRYRRWRVFFMACAEMFGARRGQEWIVSHYRFARRCR